MYENKENWTKRGGARVHNFYYVDPSLTSNSCILLEILSWCCDMGQNDTIDKIELFPSIVMSSVETNSCNNIQLFS